MWNGSEAYLEMWERANGVPHPGCARSDGEIKAHGLNHLHLGDDWVTLLRRAGQPQTRGLSWSWCVARPSNRHAADVAVLTKSGKVELVGSTAHDRTAHFISVGDPAATLASSTTSLGGGIHVAKSGSATWVYATKGATVRAVAVASATLAKRPAALRAAVKRLLAARASQAKPVFKPSAATAASAALSGKILAGTSDPRLNAAFAYLCSMQLQAY
jgi:hypothetical protein